ncbi:MAG: hypothetical protein OXI88_18910 [Gammaproteobacteria bacterium]|nr:hypothetical protein [Gammaproteobacteria bacterium]MDE0513838.1 hypothetical protein [Gammaproteobacteria bacterium]
MSAELIGIISVGAGLAALIVALLAWLRQDMKEQGERLDRKITEQVQGLRDTTAEQVQGLRDMMTEQSKEIEAVKKEVDAVKKEVGGVKIEVAALKATVETYFRVRVDPPRTTAVAEDPGDYGAD